ncbi:MAG: RNA methyltransferase [Bacteroidales bacterium]|nr:RNA methyltransferase [Bacteroidales bacterium]
MIAKTFAGLEDVLAEELRNIGCENIKPLRRAVEFHGDNIAMYKANYWCRTALRILKPVKLFNAVNEEELYKGVSEIEWWTLMDIEDTFAIDSVVNSSYFNHSKFVALKTKDAIADCFRKKFDKRPSVDTENPSVRINIRVFNDEVTVSLDSSGTSLHRRGYRIETGLAPINEVLAAGMILLSDWKRDCHFVDPMCGSGTILMEAALIANKIPPGFYRQSFGFEKWKDFDAEAWEKIKDDAIAGQQEFEHKIIGSDISGKMISISRNNIRNARMHKDIDLQASNITDYIPPAGKGIMITNPPYGERMKVEDVKSLYKKIGDTLKKNYAGYDAWIISSDLEAHKFVGLRPSRKIKVFNGPLECRFLKFSIYEGSKKFRNNA